MYEVQKDLHNVSAGIGIFYQVKYIIFVCNLTSKSARSTLTTPGRNSVKLFIYLYTTAFVFWASSQHHIPVFPLHLFLYVNIVAKRAQKLFKTLAPRLTVLGIPHFLLMHIVAHCVL
jgi:hypothetical protein